MRKTSQWKVTLQSNWSDNRSKEIIVAWSDSRISAKLIAASMSKMNVESATASRVK